MRSLILLFSMSFLSACSENSPKDIANEYCKCRQIEKSQGALQGNKCYEEWDKKYGKVTLNESQQKTFLEITQDCN